MNTRRIAEVVVPAVATMTAVLAPIVLAHRLPDPIAIHWDVSGRPDGAGSPTLEAAGIAALTAALTLLPMVAASRSRHRTTACGMVAMANGLGAVFLGMRLVTLRANLDAATWQDAGAVTAVQVGAIFVLGLLAGAWGWWLAGDRPDHAVTRREIDAVQIAPGEAVVWSSSTTGPIAAWLPGLLVLAGVVAWLVLDPGSALVVAGSLVLVGLAASMLTRATLTVGPAGVRVRLGVLGLPRLAVPIDEITGVEWEDVEPMRYGGWGYRVVPGARAVVVRRGEGLRLLRDGKPDLVVTVDDAAEAGSVVLAHLAAR